MIIGIRIPLTFPHLSRPPRKGSVESKSTLLTGRPLSDVKMMSVFL